MDLRFFCVLAFFSLISLSSADMLIYGDSLLDGRPVPVGSVISVWAADELVGNYSVREPGSYGLLVGFDGRDGVPLEFRCGDFRALQVVPFSSDGVMAIDLDFQFYEPTTTSTSFSPPSIVGNAVSVTVSDNVLVAGVFVLLSIIFFSIKDIMG